MLSLSSGSWQFWKAMALAADESSTQFDFQTERVIFNYTISAHDCLCRASEPNWCDVSIAEVREMEVQPGVSHDHLG